MKYRILDELTILSDDILEELRLRHSMPDDERLELQTYLLEITRCIKTISCYRKKP